MKYEILEGDFFFSHQVMLNVKKERIFELDQHLQTYGRRSIDWEIASQTHRNKDYHKDSLRSRYWNPVPDIHFDDSVRFRSKSDAIRFKLSWDECNPGTSEYIHGSAIYKIMQNLSFGKAFRTRYGVVSLDSLDPFIWERPKQHELDFDGSIAKRIEALSSIKFFEDSWLGKLYPEMKVHKSRNIHGNQNTPTIQGYKGTVFEDELTNLGAEIPLPGPASSSDSTT